MKFIKKMIPLPIALFLRNCYILFIQRGQLKSTFNFSSIDKDGKEIPWYTYPAIDYLFQFDFSNKIIFEYGSGNSTVFWNKIAKKVYSVEDNEDWYKKTKKKLKKTTVYMLEKNREKYINSLEKMTKKADVIIVDGSYRHSCIKKAIKNIKSTGMIIVDNSDWLPESCEYIRKNTNLIQIDFYGFGPISPFTLCTSVFISRKIKLKTIKTTQPKLGIGSLPYSYSDV
jgi:hypothetical protein